ncbi:MAG TPA: hypothetical protein VFY15_06880 [Acidimicrobiia bacterium]|nr:hypothetical protein [Acidimicrobiia bacterium]
MIRRLFLVGVIATVFVVATGSPAWADPAVPTNYRSRVTDMDPRPDGLAIQVTGGDAFLVAAVAPGHALEVPGYFGEPYLRFDPDGAVWRNERSPARHINVARYGVTIPPQADATAPPEWIRVAGDGRYAWHDHRTHWMSRDLPPTISGDRAQLIFPWEFPVAFDAAEVLVHGELVWFPSENPVGPLFLGLLGLVPLAWWHRDRTVLLAAHLAALGAVALFVATMQFAATPVDRGMPIDLVLPGSAVLLALGSLTLGRSPLRAVAARLLAASALVIWGWFAVATLTAPVLPSTLAPAVERTLVAMVLVSGAVLGILQLWGLRTATADEPPTDSSAPTVAQTAGR